MPRTLISDHRDVVGKQPSRLFCLVTRQEHALRPDLGSGEHRERGLFSAPHLLQFLGEDLDLALKLGDASRLDLGMHGTARTFTSVRSLTDATGSSRFANPSRPVKLPGATGVGASDLDSRVHGVPLPEPTSIGCQRGSLVRVRKRLEIPGGGVAFV